ncbi:hypothetical protein SPHINGO391_510152 [Sphingomonas aurantiaca]|uniref:Uncharacterized protein n=1 Tax=Sphingomonas aurantiaca TaxID=185949 RepID=A0A5E8AJK4_9SPHN|nr:hypothetical protein SPHINGO391_510152 [Sphingomonas aurantiaca]
MGLVEWRISNPARSPLAANRVRLTPR